MSTAAEAPAIRGAAAVDERPPAVRLLVLGMQHVLVMYAGNVAVPLVVAAALRLPPDQTAFLITADLFAAGAATLIQTLGFWKFGARLPVMMGATFLSVGPIIAMGSDPGMGLPAFYGALLVSGLAGILIAPLMGRILGLFPAVVTGSLIMLLGISLLSVAMDWVGGGSRAGNPGYGGTRALGIALFVFAVIVLVSKYGRGIFRNLAIMTGIVTGTLVSIPFGLVHVPGLKDAAWIALPVPFRFGMPTFHAAAIVTMCIVMIVSLVESTGVFLALADITGKQYGPRELVPALRGDGLGIVSGAVFNAFPYTSFSQNVGLVSMSGVRSRYVCAMGGSILVLLGLLPKMAHMVSAVPDPVLGGAGLVMFGMVAATGVSILSGIDFARRPHDLLIVASALGIGFIPTLSPHLLQQLPKWTAPITGSSVALGTLVAVILNLLLNGVRDKP